jgi:signal transduction histidine kinase
MPASALHHRRSGQTQSSPTRLSEPVDAAWQRDLGAALNAVWTTGPCAQVSAQVTGAATARSGAVGCGIRPALAEPGLLALPVAAALALVLFAWTRVTPGVEAALLALVLVSLVAGHLLLRSRSRRVEAEREAARIREELALRARVAECEDRRMRLAAFSRLAAQIAHEIRNPLASIALNTELLEEELSGGARDRAEMAALVASIKVEAERLQALTDEYLTFARLPEAERLIQPLNPIVADLARFVEREARQRQITILLALAPDDPAACVDARQIRQAVLNLLRNSLEAMPGGGRIDLRTAVRGDEVVIEVADTGPGIPEDRLDAVFEPFYSTKPHGTGLGLALVRRIVGEHGGRIEVESAGGASIRLVLPLASPDARTEARATAHTRGAAAMPVEVPAEGRAPCRAAAPAVVTPASPSMSTPPPGPPGPDAVPVVVTLATAGRPSPAFVTAGSTGILRHVGTHRPANPIGDAGLPGCSVAPGPATPPGHAAKTGSPRQSGDAVLPARAGRTGRAGRPDSGTAPPTPTDPVDRPGTATGAPA